MIEVEHLNKDFGTIVAVRDVSFSVARGQVVGFVGPNGAGKSTTLRILVGYLGATSGRVRVGGHDVAEDSLAARRSLGYLAETSPLYPELRVREYLACRAHMKGIARKQRRAAVERALELSAVADVADTLILHLSRGYRQRVGLADALLTSPPLLVLDEPTAGLDPNQIREVRKLIRQLGQEHTILLSTHILSEVESTCDRAIVIHRGRVIKEGSLQELSELRRSRRIIFVVHDPEARAEGCLSQVAGVDGVEVRPGQGLSEIELGWLPTVEEVGPAVETCVKALVGQGIGVREVRPARARLEDVFAELTQAAPAGEESGS
jgi:ABC-2 type transport system ATP-binding protein